MLAKRISRNDDMLSLPTTGEPIMRIQTLVSISAALAVTLALPARAAAETQPPTIQTQPLSGATSEYRILPIAAATDESERRKRLSRHALRWELAYLTLSAVDAAETISCINRGKCYEGNPLLGKGAGARTLILAKVGGGVLHFLGFQHVRRRNPMAALRLAQVTTVMQGGVVMLNAQVAF
jgi:hypothetical protein